MVSGLFSSKLPRGSGLALLTVVLIVLVHPAAAALVLGLALAVRFLLRGPALDLQPPTADRPTWSEAGAHDPMASNRWQDPPQPSRPMGPPDRHGGA
ncbi:hypothetical protein [Histidinibacterium lentulum]|uniref:Uncharacterized protein n=1 Tax=Histidinibacterium lentulum TaxID=2480588 RepID=A0A3N2R5N0_9RHOB|nr:hypothetical protein [Histidinibacterium lentulum]ROU02671.1 hypothetical protein EAT49_10130 [Histidinibacterium lentulum]